MVSPMNALAMVSINFSIARLFSRLHLLALNTPAILLQATLDSKAYTVTTQYNTKPTLYKKALQIAHTSRLANKNNLHRLLDRYP